MTSYTRTAGGTTPVLFAAAVLNFGVGRLLDELVRIAPSAAERDDDHGQPRPVDAPFSAFVFKIQAGMDAQHRDRLAYARVCSGVFERGMVNGLVDELRPALPVSDRVALVAATLAKGLEFDHVVVVEPAGFAAVPSPTADPGDRTWLRHLYVALTRAVSELTIVTTGPLSPYLTSEA